mgnify:CR=1 FL=1
MVDYKSLPDLLAAHKPYDDSEAASIKSLQQFLQDADNPFARENLYGHTVCNAWVVSPDRQQVLLLVHAESGTWLAPGGHTDGDPDMFATAARELEEETGLVPEVTKVLLNGELLDVNVGIVPERKKSFGPEPAHLHFELSFAFEADPETVHLQISEESLDLTWFSTPEAMEKLMPCHRRSAVKTLNGYLD